MRSQTHIKDHYHANTGVCVNLNTMKSVIDNVIDFYKQFAFYEHATYVELYQHISPSIRNGTHKVFQTNGEIWGFCNWAFLSPQVLKKFLIKGRLYTLDWQTGLQMVWVDVVAKRDPKLVVKWLKNYTANLYGPDQSVYWLRTDGAYNINRIGKAKIQEYWKYE